MIMQLGRSLVQLASRRPHRLSALRWQSTATAEVIDGPAITQTNRAEATLKRFWTTVGIDKRGDDLAITLDKRALKTPSGNTLLIPQNKTLLATLVAAEWDHQATVMKPHALPMTSLASRALDAMVEPTTKKEVCEALVHYLDTDTICFHQDYPDPLVKLQNDHWLPLLSWARDTFDVEILTFDSILFNTQPEDTKKKLIQVLSQFDHWEMAAMERATYTTKSFIIALALVKQHLTVEEASLAAQVEVSSQIERWGEVEDSHDVDFHDVRRQLGSAASTTKITPSFIHDVYSWDNWPKFILHPPPARQLLEQLSCRN